MKKFLIVTVILILCAGIFGYLQWNKPHEDIAAAKSDITISANELLTAFQTGEEAANAKYNDKVVEVTGAVREVTQTEGVTIVRLDAGDSMDGVTCELDADVKHKRTDFKTGDPVTFKCTCSGMNMDVVLNRCVEK